LATSPAPAPVAPPDPAVVPATPLEPETAAPPTATPRTPAAPTTTTTPSNAPLDGEDADARAAAKVKQASDEGFPTWALPALAVAGLVVFAGAVVAIEARTPEGRQDLGTAGGQCCGAVCDSLIESLLDACCQLGVDLLCAALCPAGAVAAAGVPARARDGSAAGAVPYESPPPGLGTGARGMSY